MCAAVRRRYEAGLSNFFDLYLPIAGTWRLLDNSNNRATLIASGDNGGKAFVGEEERWNELKQR